MHQNSKAPTPQTAQGAMALAEQHFRAGRLAEAEVVLRDLLKQQPGNADAVFALGLLAYSTNKLDAAIQLLEAAIEINPNSGRYHTNIAAMFGQRGDTAKAIEHGRIAVTLQPQMSEPHNNLGVAYLGSGDTSLAIDEFSTAIAIDPQNSDAFCNRANAKLKLRQLADAEQDARHAVSLSPNKVSTHNCLSAVLIARRAFTQAESVVRKAISMAPADWNALHNLALVLYSLKKYDDALMAANQAMQAFPSSAEARLIAGSVYLDRSNTSSAYKLLQQSLAINPDYQDAILALARYYFDVRQFDKAAEQARRVLQLNPRSASAQNLLGCALREQGDVTAAIKAFESSIALQPDFAPAYANLSEARTFAHADDPLLASMIALSKSIFPDDEDELLHIHFALGKAMDDLGQTDEAFKHIAEANSLRRKRIPYSESEALELSARICRTITSDVVKRFSGAGDASTVPVFVIGMPLSGTNIVAQILSAHPDVSLAGETWHVHEALQDLRGHVAGKRAFPELMQDAMPKDIAFFGHTLAGRLSRLAPQARHVVDSMPFNFHFAGLLSLALPKAKIIHVRRNPADTCLANFSKHFFSENNHTYDQAELGRYYRAYGALMAHWHNVLPAGSILDVQYEDLVTTPAAVAQRLASHCALPVHASMTQAAGQLRPPASSVGRWKLYERHLAPMLNALGDARG